VVVASLGVGLATGFALQCDVGWTASSERYAENFKDGMCDMAHTCWLGQAIILATLVTVVGLLLFQCYEAHQWQAMQRVQRQKGLTQWYIITVLVVFGLEVFYAVFGLLVKVQLPHIVVIGANLVYLSWPVANAIIFLMINRRAQWIESGKQSVRFADVDSEGNSVDKKSSTQCDTYKDKDVESGFKSLRTGFLEHHPYELAEHVAEHHPTTLRMQFDQYLVGLLMDLHGEELTVPQIVRLVRAMLAERTLAEVQLLIDEHKAKPSDKLVNALLTRSVVRPVRDSLTGELEDDEYLTDDEF